MPLAVSFNRQSANWRLYKCVSEFWLFSLHRFHTCLRISKWWMLRSKEFALAKFLGSLYTSARWLLRRWRWRLGLKVRIHVITSKFSEILGSTSYNSIYIKPTAKQSAVITKNTKLGIWPQLLDDEVKQPLSHKTPLLCTIIHSTVQSTFSPIY